MDNDIINNKFDDIDKKIDFLIELCQRLKAENVELKQKVESLQSELDRKNEAAGLFDEQQAVIKSKIDGLLSKLNDFSQAPADNDLD